MMVDLAAVLRTEKPVPTGAANADAGSDWAREFEAAGRLAWFHAPNERGGADPLRPRASEIAPQPRTGCEQRVAGGASLKAGLVPSVPQSSGPSMRPGPSPQLAGVRAAFPAAQPLPGEPLATPVVRDTGSGLAAPGSPWRPSPVRTPGPSACATAWPVTMAPTPRRQPVRVHLDASAQGVTVWLGVDGAPQAQALRAGVAAELRRLLAASGQRLDALFCNGRPVDAPAPFQPREP